MIYRPVWSSIAVAALLATGGAAMAQGSGSFGSESIEPLAPNSRSNTWHAERYAESVPIADLLDNPQRWEGRFIRTTGRLRGEETGQVGCTRMACAFPPSAQPGDQLECNRCSGPARLQAGDRSLPLGNLRCSGVEILTYGVGGQVDRTIRWDSAQFESSSVKLGGDYIAAGTLRRRLPGAPAGQPAFEFELQSIVPVAASGTDPIRGLW